MQFYLDTLRDKIDSVEMELKMLVIQHGVNILDIREAWACIKSLRQAISKLERD